MPAWFLFTLVALLSWGVWAIMGKGPGAALSPEQVQAISTLGMLPLLPMLLWGQAKEWHKLTRKGVAIAFIGGTVTCLGNVAYFAALAKGGKAASVISLTALYPLATIVLAVIFLRERLNAMQAVGILLSLVAVWCLNIQSTQGFFSPVVLYTLPPILLWGLSGFLQKLSTTEMPAKLAGFIYLAAFIPVGLYYGLQQPRPTMTPQVWVSTLGVGFFLALGNVAVIAAFARGGKASVITPMGSLYPIVSIPLAVALFGEKVTGREWSGIALALLAVLALSRESADPAAPPT